MKKLFYFVLILCFFGVINISFGQTGADSLVNLAKKTSINDKNTALRFYLQAMKLLEKDTKNKDAQDKLAIVYFEIGKVYESGKLHENALEYYQKSYKIADNLASLEAIAENFYAAKKYKEALEYYFNAINAQKNAPNLRYEIKLLNQVVHCYEKLNLFDKALATNLTILETTQTANDLKEEELVALNNLGYNYRHIGNYNKAIDVLRKALTLQKTLNKSVNVQIVTLTNLGVVFQNLGNYQNAIEQLLEALMLVKKTKNQLQEAEINNLLSAIYLNSKDFYNAEIYNDLAIDYAEKANQADLLEKVYKTKSDILQAKEEFQAALTYYKRHLSLKDSLLLRQTIEKQRLLQQQFLVEREEKKTLDAIASEELRKAELEQVKAELEQQKLMNEKEVVAQKADAERAKNEQLKQKTAKELAEKELLILKQQNEGRERESEILALEKEKALQDLAIQKQEAEERITQTKIAQLKKDSEIQQLKNLQKDLQAQKQDEENKFLYAILVFVALMTIIILYILYNVRKKNKLLALQKHEIIEKNTELEMTQVELEAQRDALEQKSSELDHAYNNIKSSITYAKRIQTAILPPIINIQKNFSDSFVLFQPRDIVSGDFYWFNKNEDGSSVFAVVDCTGHGVPGAFMSMIGDSLLNQIVIEKEIYSPEIILSELDKGIRQTLQKGDQNAKDGMDLSVVYIDKLQENMYFAGAMNPICYVQNGELIEIKADKRAIGADGSDTFLYTKHHIEIKSKTRVYMYSDGFQDQFGGANDKKFMVKRFRELLFQIHEKPFAEQQEILQNTFKQWIGTKYKQIDDVLVIGFVLG